MGDKLELVGKVADMERGKARCFAHGFPRTAARFLRMSAWDNLDVGVGRQIVGRAEQRTRAVADARTCTTLPIAGTHQRTSEHKYPWTRSQKSMCGSPSGLTRSLTRCNAPATSSWRPTNA